MPLNIKYKEKELGRKANRSPVGGKREQPGRVLKGSRKVTSRDWPLMMEHYINKNIAATDGNKYTLGMTAAHYGVNSDDLRRVASEQRWKDKLEEAIKERDIQVRKKLADHRANVIINAQTLGPMTEARVRVQQSQIARMARDLAAKRLKKMKPDELTVSQAISLLQLGLAEERKSLGIPDKYEVHVEDEGSDYMSTQRAREILGRVIEMARNKDGSYQSAEAGQRG